MTFNTTQGHVSTIESKINSLESHLDAAGDTSGLALARALHSALNEAHADFIEKYPDEAGDALLRSGGTGKDGGGRAAPTEDEVVEAPAEVETPAADEE